MTAFKQVERKWKHGKPKSILNNEQRLVDKPTGGQGLRPITLEGHSLIFSKSDASSHTVDGRKNMPHSYANICRSFSPKWCEIYFVTRAVGPTIPGRHSANYRKQKRSLEAQLFNSEQILGKEQGFKIPFGCILKPGAKKRWSPFVPLKENNDSS